MSYYTDPRRYFIEMELHSAKKKLLFEGDSWFSIPTIGNIPIQLDSLGDFSILCLADPGDTLEQLTDGPQYPMLNALVDTEQWGQKWDALLLSAGGNDVIGPEIRTLLKAPPHGGTDPKAYVKGDVLKATLKKMRERFLKLMHMRDASQINGGMPIFVHTYSYLTPRNIPHQLIAWRLSGPWIYPHMKSTGIVDCDVQQAIVRYLLDSFREMLGDIEANNALFHVIDTRQALPPVPCLERDSSTAYWRDEIHPSSAGFKRIAQDYFMPALRNADVVS